MGRMDDKVAIVTGAASGLGQATSRRLHAEGARVMLADLQEEAGSTLAKELGDGAQFRRHDVTLESDWEALVAATEAAFGALHVLVNGAGIVAIGSVEETSLETWRRVMAVNLDGVFLGCKHALPLLTRSGRGSIVNISSVAGLSGTPPFAAYSASKGGVRALSRTVAADCRARGVKVRSNSIHPGGIDTPMTRGLGAAAAGAGPITLSLLQGFGEGASLGRPDDVAELILYLASDESRHVNGVEIPIDGGDLAG